MAKFDIKVKVTTWIGHEFKEPSERSPNAPSEQTQNKTNDETKLSERQKM